MQGNIKQAFEYASKNPNSDFARNLSQLASSGSLNVEAKANGIDLTPFQPKQEIVQPEQPKTLGQKIVGAAQGITNFVGAKGISEQFGSDIARSSVPEEQKNLIPYPTQKEVIGSAIQSGANLIPGAGKGLGLLAKTAIGAGTGYAFDVGSKLQEDKSINESLTPGLGTAIGGSLPVVGALTKNLIFKPLSRIVKGLGAGVSGGSIDDINNILKDPTTARKVSDAFKQKGNIDILKNEAETIMNGVSKIRKEASSAFGKGLDELKSTDINPTTFREKIGNTLDTFGSLTNNGKRELTNVEFSDPKNIKKASELIAKLQTVKLDGKSLRKLSDDIESSLYKTATSDERISFNRFIQDLSGSLKGAISETTPKLGEINKAYSQDIQLADAVQAIFGDVKFKSLEEINNMAKKISGISSEGGISPEIIDNFFARIGKSGQEFKTGESVRKIMSKSGGANKMGINFSEIIQAVTAGAITPNLIKNIAIVTGKTEPVIKKILENTSSPARKALLNSLVVIKKDSQN